VPRFSGSSFLELPTLRHVAKAFQLEVWLLTYKTEGLVLYNGQHSNGNGDFLSLRVTGARAEMRFDLGGGVTVLTSPDRLVLGQWHKVRMRRDGARATLQLDDGHVVEAEAHGTLTELNLEMPLYLGGVRYEENTNFN
jgi:coxsackievirus/adenovirus receptor